MSEPPPTLQEASITSDDDLDRDFDGPNYNGNIYGNCPVQADGLVLGLPFYFRARGNGWQLRIGGTNGVNGECFAEGRYGTEYEAGWMPKPLARRLIRSLLKLYIDQAPTAQPTPNPESGADFTFEQPTDPGPDEMRLRGLTRVQIIKQFTDAILLSNPLNPTKE